MKKKNILVTGGAGYIGAITVKQLQKLGYNTIIVDDLSTGHNQHISGTFYQVTLLDRSKLHDIFEKEDIGIVMHFASLTLPPESMEKPEKYYRENINSTLNLLEEMFEHNVTNIIFSSSCSIYGTPKKLPVTETSPINPDSVYASTKAIIEEMLLFFEETRGIHSVSLRYFNVCGALPDNSLGEKHDPETHLIPNIIKSLLSNNSFPLYGNDYDTRDGTCIRDYVHVLDIAHGHIQAIKYLEKNNRSTAFNLGNNKGYSIKEVISEVEKITGKNLKVIINPRRKGDPAKVYADNKKAKTELQWEPKYSDLKTIIQTALAWEQKKLNEK